MPAKCLKYVKINPNLYIVKLTTHVSDIYLISKQVWIILWIRNWWTLLSCAGYTLHVQSSHGSTFLCEI